MKYFKALDSDKAPSYEYSHLRFYGSISNNKRILHKESAIRAMLKRKFENVQKMLGNRNCHFSKHLLTWLGNPIRRTKISVQCKVLTALSFFATGSYQKSVGISYLHGLCQTSVSRVVKEVTTALNNENILRRYIRFPQTVHERRTVVNGCQKDLLIVLNDAYNRTIICDSDLNIMNVDASYGGATHDAYIWRNCEIHDHIRQVHQTGECVWFLGTTEY
ncbi:hypothetical protein NQ315_011368 [Exocentrus adspersus]|uniref:DDE Tnp4 domain-containing protein n=1 Tax=Exocentrus adspersus TaxID=1586481 RepID=A0AAV8V8A6_9CUCU|nr:hypothetical protein NQ315_011368 [Exocentrus adspersus]